MTRKHKTVFGEYVKSKGTTQREIAERLGISEESVSNKANGATSWKLDEMRALYGMFGMEVIELLMKGE